MASSVSIRAKFSFCLDLEGCSFHPTDPSIWVTPPVTGRWRNCFCTTFCPYPSIVLLSSPANPALEIPELEWYAAYAQPYCTVTSVKWRFFCLSEVTIAFVWVEHFALLYRYVLDFQKFYEKPPCYAASKLTSPFRSVISDLP